MNFKPRTKKPTNPTLRHMGFALPLAQQREELGKRKIRCEPSATTNAQGVSSTRHERSVPKHHSTVLRKRRKSQNLSKGISDHLKRAKRNELKDASVDQLADKISSNINVARMFAADRIFGHSNVSHVVLIDCGRSRLRNCKIREHFP